MLNLDRNSRIGIVVVICALSTLALFRNKRLIGNLFWIGTVSLVLGGVGYIAHEMNLMGESFGNYTTQSPVEGGNQAPKCYNNGEEVDCELLNSEDNSDNSQDDSSQDVGGSYGIDKDEVFKPVPNKPSDNQLPNECYPKDILSPSELLPKDSDSVWAQSVPSGQGSLGDQNFLNAGYHVGMNTVGQTLRNGNRQLRSDPPNPQVKVSPWMQTTIEPDTNRKSMEIGN